MKIFLGKYSIIINAHKTSFLGKFLGLMFRKKTTRNLLFEFKNWERPSIHSFFVFFDFLAVWLDKTNKVVDFSVVNPFTLSVKPRRPSVKLLEIPLNTANEEAIRFFSVGKRKV